MIYPTIYVLQGESYRLRGLRLAGPAATAAEAVNHFPMCQHRLTEQLNSPCSIQTHGRPGKTGSILCFSMAIKKCNNSSMCCGGFHSRATLSGSRYQGRTPPNVVPRTPCPKAKARTGHNARHGLPHSTCTPFFSCLPETSLPFWAAGKH